VRANQATEKVYHQLQGEQLMSLREDMLRNYPVLRRTSYGKQVIAIEKLLFGNNGLPPVPPLTPAASSRSSTLPSSADSDALQVQRGDVKEHT
jgi:mRNA-binding protein PUF3